LKQTPHSIHGKSISCLPLRLNVDTYVCLIARKNGNNRRNSSVLGRDYTLYGAAYSKLNSIRRVSTITMSGKGI